MENKEIRKVIDQDLEFLSEILVEEGWYIIRRSISPQVHGFHAGFIVEVIISDERDFPPIDAIEDLEETAIYDAQDIREVTALVQTVAPDAVFEKQYYEWLVFSWEVTNIEEE